MLDGQSARQALERGDIDAAKAHLAKADRAFRAFSIGCLVVVIACIVFALLAMFAR